MLLSQSWTTYFEDLPKIFIQSSGKILQHYYKIASDTFILPHVLLALSLNTLDYVNCLETKKFGLSHPKAIANTDGV
jgi:hypothetical protein